MANRRVGIVEGAPRASGDELRTRMMKGTVREALARVAVPRAATVANALNTPSSIVSDGCEDAWR